MGRLTGATYPAPVPGQPAGGVYGYDWVDNRLTPPGASPMLYNSVDQLTSWPGMYDYTYYSDGSLKEVRTPQGALVASYTYNSDGLLESATYGSTILSQDWDGMGNRVGLRIQKNGGAEQVWSFLYDPTAGVPAVLEEAGPDGVVVRYFRTPGGSLIARVKGSDWRYYHFDGLGSVVALSDESGTLTDKYTYDEWGNLLTHTDPDTGDAIGLTLDNPYQYVGQYGYYTHHQQSDFKMLQLGARYYDPSTGRFTQKDLARDGLNWYAYVGGNPLTRLDPTGYTWGDNWGLIKDWWLERGSERRCYGGGNASTSEMRRTPGVAKARAIAAASCRDDCIGISTPEAFYYTILDPQNGTQAQVGAYRICWHFNSSGTVTYTITNTVSINSAFYHIPEPLEKLRRRFPWLPLPYIPVAPPRSDPGPGGNMYQTFTWTEAAPAGCRSRGAGGLCAPPSGSPNP